MPVCTCDCFCDKGLLGAPVFFCHCTGCRNSHVRTYGISTHMHGVGMVQHSVLSV
jgi:hypothetical protein